MSEEVALNKTEAQRISGVDKGVFYYHLKRNPEFRRWLSEQCDIMLVVNKVAATCGLIKAIQRGDLRAIRLSYELEGKLKSRLVR